MEAVVQCVTEFDISHQGIVVEGRRALTERDVFEAAEKVWAEDIQNRRPFGLYFPFNEAGAIELVVNLLCIVLGAVGVRFAWLLAPQGRGA